MDDARVESFNFNGVKIQTTVIDIKNKMLIDDHISSFLHTANKNGTKVIGFDAQWLVSENSEYGAYYFQPRCATLHFCDGFSCLIIQLSHLDLFWSVKSVTSLLNFLSLPDYTFVGIGIKDNLAKLEKLYGIGCRNAVELGPMAANLMKMPRLSYCGVDELAYYVVNKLDLRNLRPLITDFNWGSYPLGVELVKHATVNVYSYYKIGSTLLCSDAILPQEPRVGWFGRWF